jgi:signal transduction histidine kinase
MTTTEPTDVLADHEDRLRRVEATLRALARLPTASDRPLTDTRLLHPGATPGAVPWPSARTVPADPPPEADPTAERFVTLGRALAGTAHDLNNLLAVVQGYAELLMEELAGDPRRESAVGIQAAAELAGGVVRHLLGVARPSAGTPPRVDVGLHLGRLERLLKAVLMGGGGGVRLELDNRCGAAFAGIAPAELTQIVLNLAVNARDAMPDGGGLQVWAVPVAGGPGLDGWPVGLTAGSWIEVSVTDSGHGIDPAVRERIGRPGEGLGLMTVGDILARCGGHLLLESPAQGGTRVRVFLPRA